MPLSNYSAQSVGSYSIAKPTRELFLETAELILNKLSVHDYVAHQ